MDFESKLVFRSWWSLSNSSANRKRKFFRILVTPFVQWSSMAAKSENNYKTRDRAIYGILLLLSEIICILFFHFCFLEYPVSEISSLYCQILSHLYQNPDWSSFMLVIFFILFILLFIILFHRFHVFRRFAYNNINVKKYFFG